MDKLKMHTPDKTDENIDKIAALFPNAVTEVIKGYRDDGSAIVEHAIDFDVLHQELSNVIIEGPQERYQFTWPDKRKSVLLANQPIAKTMRPCREESVDFDTTENLYIEGDNLDALKLLQETYLGKVKMIYIDPPYNTGNDFVYDDDFVQGTDEYMAGSGQYDEEGGRLVANLESNGRFHTDWLNMMYPRLKLAKDLLLNDGVIFISISDIEVVNIRKMCDEVFGSSNFVADLIWANKEGGGSSDSRLFRIKHEHIVCYAKQIDTVEIVGVPVSNEERYKSQDEYVATRGKYYLQKLGMGSIQYSSSLDYPIETPDNTTVYPADNNNGKKACWRWSKSKYDWGKANGFIEIKKDSQGVWTVYTKQYLNCDNDGNIIIRTQRPMGIINEYSSTQASKFLESIGLGNAFSYSKPIELIKYLLSRSIMKNAYILDFFSGSATTAHAVMQLNAEDGGHRKFIMVQLPEETDEKSGAYKAGYKNICEIGKERIRRAGRKIQEEAGLMAQNLDIGFRVLKIDSTNMRKVKHNPAEIKQDQIGMFADNIKPDRTGEDLLFQVMLDLGILLSSKIEEKEIGGKHVFSVAGGYLIACFDNNVTSDTVTEIAKMKPYYAVFRDSGMANDSVATNFEQIFATYSPTTVRKVL